MSRVSENTGQQSKRFRSKYEKNASSRIFFEQKFRSKFSPGRAVISFESTGFRLELYYWAMTFRFEFFFVKLVLVICVYFFMKTRPALLTPKVWKTIGTDFSHFLPKTPEIYFHLNHEAVKILRGAFHGKLQCLSMGVLLLKKCSKLRSVAKNGKLIFKCSKKVSKGVRNIRSSYRERPRYFNPRIENDVVWRKKSIQHNSNLSRSMSIVRSLIKTFQFLNNNCHNQMWKLQRKISCASLLPNVCLYDSFEPLFLTSDFEINCVFGEIKWSNWVFCGVILHFLFLVPHSNQWLRHIHVNYAFCYPIGLFWRYISSFCIL